MQRKSENESTKCVAYIPPHMHHWVVRYIDAYKEKWYYEDVNKNNCRWIPPAKLQDVTKPYILINLIAEMGLPAFKELVQELEAETAKNEKVFNL